MHMYSSLMNALTKNSLRKRMHPRFYPLSPLIFLTESIFHAVDVAAYETIFVRPALL